MIFFSDSVKNTRLFRRVTSSIIASVFALSFGICSVKSAKAEEVERFKFCDQHKSLFHLNSGAKRKVRIAVFDIKGKNNNSNVLNNPYEASQTEGQSTYQFQGHSDILASELIEDNNFAVVNWSQIQPTYKDSQNPEKLELQTLITLENLREIRNRYGVEAVLIGTVHEFKFSGENTKQFLGFGKTTKNDEAYIKLNFRVIDTTTGEIIFAAKGNGHSNSKSSTNVTIPKISVDMTKKAGYLGTNNSYGIQQNDYSIVLKISSDSTEQIISSSSKNITEKLIAPATEDAIYQIVEEFNTHSDKLACLLRKPTLVADAEGDKVILNKGKMHGYCKGMRLSIERKPKPVKDPATGRTLRIKTQEIGKITLTEIDSQSSLGKEDKTDKPKQFKVGDLAKPINPEFCIKNSFDDKQKSSDEEQSQV